MALGQWVFFLEKWHLELFIKPDLLKKAKRLLRVKTNHKECHEWKMTDGTLLVRRV